MNAPAVAVVTGAGRGLGRAIAVALGARGLTVVAVDTDRDLLRWTDATDESADYRPICADVSAATDVDAMMAQLEREFGRVDVLVNNAGILTVTSSDALADSEWERILQVNLGGTIRMCRAAYPLLRRGATPCIVNISSITGQLGFPGRLAYAASKAAIDSVTRTLAVEWGPAGIRVNSIAPGFFSTERAALVHAQGEADADRRSSLTPLRRHGAPAEIGSTVVWLALEATFVTGQVLVVDGGLSVSAEATVTPLVQTRFE